MNGHVRDVIQRSAGVLVACFGDRVVAVDTVEAVVHLIEGSFGWLLMFDEPMTVDTVVDEVARDAGVPPAEMRYNVIAALEWLRARHLIGRQSPSATAQPSPDSPLVGDARLAGLAHPVLDARVAFRSSDADLLTTVDGLLAGGLPDVRPTHWIDVAFNDLGWVAATATGEHRFSSERELLERLVDIVNESAARATDLAVLQAGAVRAPSGEVWILLDQIDASRSALTAALLQAGCDYLGSEAIGVRGGTLDAVAYPTPLRLDPDNRTAIGIPASRFPPIPVPEVREDVSILNGDHGPVGGLLFVDYRPDRSATAELLDPTAALHALLAEALNLRWVGDPQLQALCDLASTTPAARVTHHDAVALAHRLVDAGLSTLGQDLDHALRLERRRLDDAAVVREHADLVVRRAMDVGWAAIEADREPSAVLWSPSEPACGLTGPALALWLRLGSETTFEHLVRTTADSQGGSDSRAAPDIAWLLSQFERCGLLALDDGPSGTSPFTQLAEVLAPDGPTESAEASVLQSNRIPRLRADTSAADWADWVSIAVTHEVAGIPVVTDHPDVSRVLRQTVDSPSRPSRPPTLDSERRVEVRMLPGNGAGALIRDGDHLEWTRPEALLSSLALAVSALLEDVPPARLESLPPVPAGHLWVDAEGSLFVGDQDRAREWLLSGALPVRSRICRVPIPAVSLVVGERDSELATWVEAVEISASRSCRSHPALLHLLGSSRIGAFTESERRRTVQVDLIPSVRSSGVDLSPKAGANGQSDRPAVTLRYAGGSPPDGQTRSTIPQWARHLGHTALGDASAKISCAGITVGRPLTKVSFDQGRSDFEPTGDASVRRIAEAYIDIGLPSSHAVEAALVAVSAGNFYIGEQHDGTGRWRRKLYVHEPSERAWSWLADRWPDQLARASDLPTWTAWKWSSDPGAGVEHSIDIGFLRGAKTVAEVVDPVLDDMDGDWAEAVRNLIAPLHVAATAAPEQLDALTLDEGGRRSIDLTTRGRNRLIVLGELEPELRWLAAVGGHDRASADQLVSWAWTGRLANVIFGADGHGEPFVNLYITP